MGQDSNTVEEAMPGEEPKACEEPIAPQDSAAQEKPKAGENRRLNPRLQCSGSAGIQTLPVREKPCPAKIIDLSIGGCLMEFERPLALAKDEIVELIFSVNHMPFHVRGQVRAIRSETLVGFQFPHLIDRVREHLRDLIRELIEQNKKIRQEILANRTNENEEKPSPIPAALPTRGQTLKPPVKPVELQPGNSANRAEPRRRWF